MKKLIFTTRNDFDKWYEMDGNAVWGMYYNHTFICDVLEEDYSYLLDVGFIHENGDFKQKLSDEQLTLFKENYGVDVFIIEERAQLSPKQLEIIERYKFILEEMCKNKIDICTDCDTNKMYFVNYSEFETVGDADEHSFYIPTDNLPSCPRISDVWFNSSTDKGVPCIV